MSMSSPFTTLQADSGNFSQIFDNIASLSYA
jgi:hypothetical protein